MTALRFGTETGRVAVLIQHQNRETGDGAGVGLGRLWVRGAHQCLHEVSSGRESLGNWRSPEETQNRTYEVKNSMEAGLALESVPGSVGLTP
jgi:hypothetical protein